jgi:hypothetical protein
MERIAMRARYVPVFILVAGLLAVTLNAARQDASATLTPQEGIRLMRTVNTSENVIKSGSGAYASLGDVMAHRSFSPGTAGPLTRAGADEASVKSYRLVLARAADGQGYQAALTPLSGGGTAWFTDERGVIFVGQALQ